MSRPEQNTSTTALLMTRGEGWSKPARSGEGQGCLCVCTPRWGLTSEYEITLPVKLRGNEFQTKMLLKTKIKPQNKHTTIKKAQSQTIIQSSEAPARITVLSQPVQTQTHWVLAVWEEQTYSTKSNKFRRRNWNGKAW